MEENSKENLSFQAEVSKLLDLVANSLYSEREIFLRELISNSADACEKLRYQSLSKKNLLKDDKDLKINIRVSKKKKIIEIEDNGIGMCKQDLIDNFSSDSILKEDILKINTAMDKVDSLSGYEFTWNDLIGDERAGTKDYGVIAQEIENVLPHAVNINSRGYKTVNYNSLIPLLIEAVKELSARVKELENPEEEIDG